jgi:hypothetical protein
LDETTWRLSGATRWLWVAASALIACYRIDPSRSQQAAKDLIGEDFGGFAITVRYAAYHFLDVLQQQICWCHVIRQLIEVSEREGAAGRRGKKLVELARQVIALHREYVAHDHDPGGSQKCSHHCARRSARCSRSALQGAISGPRTSPLDCFANTTPCGHSPTCPRPV